VGRGYPLPHWGEAVPPPHKFLAFGSQNGPHFEFLTFGAFWVVFFLQFSSCLPPTLSRLHHDSQIWSDAYMSVVRCDPVRSDVVRRDPMWSDAVISHTTYLVGINNERIELQINTNTNL